MRISNNVVIQRQLAGLMANAAAMDHAQAAVTSGKRVTTVSDDPGAAIGVMSSGSSLRALDQYRSNVQQASTRVAAEDSVLQQIGDLLNRVKELGVSQATATATDDSRAAANAEMKQLFDQIVTLGNTKFGDEYLFGGDQTTVQPFGTTGSGATLDYTTTDPRGTRAITIGEGQWMATAHDGGQVFLDTGVLAAVRDLSRALDPASATHGQDGIGAALTRVDSAFSAIQGVVGEVGAEGTRLDVAGQNLDAYKTNLTTLKSNLEDVDMETAITELTSRQVAYQAAMLATSKVMGITLTDYLR